MEWECYNWMFNNVFEVLNVNCCWVFFLFLLVFILLLYCVVNIVKIILIIIIMDVLIVFLIVIGKLFDGNWDNFIFCVVFEEKKIVLRYYINNLYC